MRVNIPLELAEKILPTIDKDQFHNGKVKIDHFDCNGVDFHALLSAVRDSKDGEFVTVQSKDQDVRVAKQDNYFLVHVLDKELTPRTVSAVEVKIPMKSSTRCSRPVRMKSTSSPGCMHWRCKATPNSFR